MAQDAERMFDQYLQAYGKFLQTLSPANYRRKTQERWEQVLDMYGREAKSRPAGSSNAPPHPPGPFGRGGGKRDLRRPFTLPPPSSGGTSTGHARVPVKEEPLPAFAPGAGEEAGASRKRQAEEGKEGAAKTHRTGEPETPPPPKKAGLWDASYLNSPDYHSRYEWDSDDSAEW